ncbi:hypothetical protein FHI69_03120 [Janthinobacterium lividum]|uniref:Uncharacterized protein n=1 Tax=Janthinobacterium lividum TaxID=29581 RepID=A0A5C4NXM7_9BURK|nr:hypothetical protein [Janthinobacterium lividum]TNC78298.1 hypothetical protein FHI69_03120 [Janthinobacterium lividum]
MSARDHDAAHLRDELIFKLTEEKYEAARVIVLGGGAGANGIANQLLDALAEPGAMCVLARTALACDAETAGQALKSFVVNTLVAEADAAATQAIDGAAHQRKDDPECCYPTARQELKLRHIEHPP